MHAAAPVIIQPPGRAAATALFGLLGFSAGLPFYMFSTVLALRLQAHGVGLVVIGFFAWITLLPTMKFLWAPVLDRLSTSLTAALADPEVDKALLGQGIQGMRVGRGELTGFVRSETEKWSKVVKAAGITAE